MKHGVWTALLLSCAFAAQAADRVEPKVVYGVDDRQDLYEVTDPKVVKLADSTVALFHSSDVKTTAGRAELSLQHYGTAYGLCKEEPYFDQTIGAFCSGSLVAPDVIMTAGHCVVTEDACKTTSFVFGYGIKAKGDNPKTVAAGDVYTCSKLIGREQIGTGPDWALVKLDRVVKGHAPLKLNLAAGVQKGDPVFVIGHPAGLPTKVAGGANVRDASFNGFFQANLDTYGGNSGSAVFSARTGLVEGILVRGEMDYAYKGDCRISNVVPNDGGRGEDVTKLSSVGFPKPVDEARKKSRLIPIGQHLASILEQSQLLQAQ